MVSQLCVFGMQACDPPDPQACTSNSLPLAPRILSRNARFAVNCCENETIGVMFDLLSRSTWESP
jgi:hypothetical protein